MTIYERYCELRNSKNLRDADVSAATKIGKSTFSDWKSGRSVPKQDKLEKIASFMGVSMEYLLHGSDDFHHDQDPRADLDASADLKRDLIKYFDACPPELQRSLVDLAKAYALQRQSSSKDQDPHSQSAE